MAYLLDTDTISAALRPRPSIRVTRELATRSPAEMYTSAINVGELIYGALRVNRADLLARIREVLDVLPAIPFDVAAAEIFGKLKADLERAGTSLAEPDLRIAAVALAHNLILVTGNGRHFSRVPGLIIEDWV